MPVPKIGNPFALWEEGMNYDFAGLYGLSASKFQEAAQAFFESGSMESKASKANFEYSTLMDAYSRIQQGRELLKLKKFDDALGKFKESSSILRSTIHFGFLAPYVSACAIIQATELGDQSVETSVEGYKNAIALLEQSKIALSFKDELDPLMRKIDGYIRYCISQALRLESLEQYNKGDAQGGFDKSIRSRALKQEFLSGAKELELPSGSKLQFLPLLDFERVNKGPFVISYPDTEGLWLINLGRNSANLIKVGNISLNQVVLESTESIHFGADEIGKGKIRLEYEDNLTGQKFNEGCLQVI